MACPKCGGSKRRQIAPGFYECESVISEVRPGYMPVPEPGHGPVREWTIGPTRGERICRHRYQAGEPATASAVKCWCGMYAIAECTECGAPLCGDHIRRLSGRVICQEDLAARKAADEVRRIEDEKDGGKRELANFLAELRSIASGLSDPIERILSVADSTRAFYGRIPEVNALIGELVGDPGPIFRLTSDMRFEAIRADDLGAWVYRYPGAAGKTNVNFTFDKKGRVVHPKGVRWNNFMPAEQVSVLAGLLDIPHIEYQRVRAEYYYLLKRAGWRL